MNSKILREITPLTQNDCFTIFSRVKSYFDFPIHYHEEIEINFIENGSGANRVIGDHIEEIAEYELVMVGSNLQHAWQTHKCTSKEIKEVTIQFHKDLFSERFLKRNQLSNMRTMFDKSSRGILFSKETAMQLSERIIALPKKQGFDSILELMSILHDLSISRNIRVLSDGSFNDANPIAYKSRRIEKVYEHMNQNFDKEIELSEVAKIANMSSASFSRFFKQKTGTTFIDALTEIRLGNASRMLIDTTLSVAEIAYHCGYNNISNFNRIFKKRKSCSPIKFRDSYSGRSFFI